MSTETKEKKSILNSEEVFADLPEYLDPQEPFLFIYDDFLDLEFAHQLRTKLLESWPQCPISDSDKASNKAEYRGDLISFWHCAQKKLDLLEELSEAIAKRLDHLNLEACDTSAYCLPSDYIQGLHRDENFVNLVIHLSMPKFKAVGGDTILYSCQYPDIVFEDEAKDNPTILNSWARIVPRKFNRAILLNGNFTHGSTHLEASDTNNPSEFRLSLTFFHRFK